MDAPAQSGWRWVSPVPTLAAALYSTAGLAFFSRRRLAWLQLFQGMGWQGKGIEARMGIALRSE
jgi:hypothetical protein